MNQRRDQDFSTEKITPQLISQIIDALKNKAYGSVEIYIQNYTVVQITERTITKVSRLNGQVQKQNGSRSYSSSESRLAGRVEKSSKVSSRPRQLAGLEQ